jgi:transcription initiation factor TFIID subunit TAF12
MRRRFALAGVPHLSRQTVPAFIQLRASARPTFDLPGSAGRPRRVANAEGHGANVVVSSATRATRADVRGGMISRTCRARSALVTGMVPESRQSRRCSTRGCPRDVDRAIARCAD